MTQTTQVLRNPEGWVLGRGRFARETVEKIACVALDGCPSLIVGETGSGKEIVARLIHQSGRRASKPFIAVNCPATPVTLFESLFFGHTRGAYTGASETTNGFVGAAEGGTLFLDEVGELDVLLQPKLLRALERNEVRRVGESRETTVDFQLLSATNRNIPAEIAAGRFRQDFYFRLNIITIEVPPLRDRTDDIPALVEYFSNKHAAKRGVEPKKLDPGVLREFEAYTWPGNIRELEHLIHRAYVLNRPICLDDQRVPERSPLPTLKVKELTKMAIAHALQISGGRIGAAARLCGIARATVERHAPSEMELGRRKKPDSEKSRIASSEVPAAPHDPAAVNGSAN